MTASDEHTNVTCYAAVETGEVSMAVAPEVEVKFNKMMDFGWHYLAAGGSAKAQWVKIDSNSGSNGGRIAVEGDETWKRDLKRTKA